MATITSEPLCMNLCWLLSHTSHALNTEMTAAMSDLGLSPRAHSVLVKASSGEYSQSEIALAAGLDKTTMVVTMDELEAAGLAERRPSKTDRRARVITVTAAGKRKLSNAQKIMERVQCEILATLPAREREALVDGLRRLATERLSTPVQCDRPVRRRA